MPGKYPLYNVNPKVNPEQFNDAVNRTVRLVLDSPDDIIEGGLSWYPSVRSATHSGARTLGIPDLSGAGIVAAVSPNMDFDSNNIHAFGELSNLQPVEKAMVRESARQSSDNRTFNRLLETQYRLRGEQVPEGFLKPVGRIPEVKDMLRERAPSVSTAPDANIVKALDIMEGQDPNEKLPYTSAPKTNSFMWDIHGVPRGTIDGRASDLIANMMRPWEIGRGIGSAGRKDGKPTRYEDNVAVLQAAIPRVNRSSRIRSFTGGHGVDVSDIQAIKWLRGKMIERTKPDGTVMKQGPARKGQPYI